MAVIMERRVSNIVFIFFLFFLEQWLLELVFSVHNVSVNPEKQICFFSISRALHVFLCLFQLMLNTRMSDS